MPDVELTDPNQSVVTDGAAASNAAWGQLTLRTPPKTLTELATAIDKSTTAINTILEVGRVTAELIETAAPIYADAAVAIERAAIKAIRELIQSLRVGGHAIVLDVPYGFLSDGPEDTKSGEYFRARAIAALPEIDPLALMPASRVGGTPGMLKKLLGTLNDPGDGCRPIIGPKTAVMGLSLVAGAQDMFAYRKAIQQIKRLLDLLFPQNTAPSYGLFEGARPSELKLIPTGSGVLLRWRDPMNGQKTQLTDAGGLVVTYDGPPVSVRIYGAVAPQALTSPPQGTTSALTGPTDHSDLWKLLRDVPAKDLKETYFTGSSFSQGTQYEAHIELSDLTSTLPQAETACPAWYFAVQFVHSNVLFEVPSVAGVAGVTAASCLSPSATDEFIPAPRPASVGSVAPDWRGGTTPDLLALGGRDGQGLLNTALTDFETRVLRDWEEGLEGIADDIALAAKKTKQFIAKTQKLLSDINDLVQAIIDLLKSGLTFYARGFQYFLSENGVELYEDTPPPMGYAALQKEYTESFSALPFRGPADPVIGLFVVLTGPALSAQATAVKTQFEFLLSLFGLRWDSDTRRAVAAASAAGPAWDSAAAAWAALGGAEVAPEPRPGAATAPPPSNDGAPALGTDEATARSQGLDLDFNCP